MATTDATKSQSMGSVPLSASIDPLKHRVIRVMNTAIKNEPTNGGNKTKNSHDICKTCIAISNATRPL